MALTDLRYAANLLKNGFSADEVRQIMGMKITEEPAEITPEDTGKDEAGSADEPEQEENVQTEPENDSNGTELALDPAREEEKNVQKENPLTRNENPKKESIVDALSKLL